MVSNCVYGRTPFRGIGNRPSQPAGSSYELVEDPGKKPPVAPKPLRDTGETTNHSAVSDASDLYAEVDKKRKMPPSVTYAHVDKTGTGAAVKEEPSTSSQVLQSDTKAKPAPKPKPNKKGKQTKSKAKQQKEGTIDEGVEYSNMGGLLSMSPMQGKGAEYENFALEHDSQSRTAVGSAESEPKSRKKNAEDVEYVTLEFSDRQREREKQPAPEREQTDYASIDFTKKPSPPTD